MSVDLDAIRASRAACADIPWSCPCVSGEQLDALVDELERLRSERSLLEQEARIRRRLCNRFADEVEQLRMMVDGLETAAHEERAAVAAWLRAPGTSCDTDVLADAIERGEHRREHVASDEDDNDGDPSSSWRFCEGCGCRKETARYRSWSDHAWCSDCTSRE